VPAVYAENGLVVALIGVMNDGHLIRSKGVADTVLSRDEDETTRHLADPESPRVSLCLLNCACLDYITSVYSRRSR
jgi:hypothetical protein